MSSETYNTCPDLKRQKTVKKNTAGGRFISFSHENIEKLCPTFTDLPKSVKHFLKSKRKVSFILLII